MIRTITIFYSILLLGVTGVQAQQVQLQAIERANAAYNEGLFQEAYTGYLAVAEAGYEAPGLFYNLGNACFKMDDIPRAILWYERALRLDPGNEDIRYNLNVANSKIADKIDPLPELFYTRWWRDLVSLFSLRAWAVASIVFFILTLTATTFYFVSRHLLVRKTGFWAAILSLVFTLLMVLLAQSAFQTKNRHEAIIFDPTVTAKSSPDEKSVDLFVLHEGTKVEIVDQIGLWYEIRIANGSIGWLPEQVIESI